MKALLVLSVLVSTTSFAQTLDLKGLKSLLTQRQAVLERVNQGMTKQLNTVSKIPTELGACEISETAVQTVLKVEGSKIIVHSKERYTPAATPACAGFETQEVAVLFYEDKPSLVADLADLDESAKDIRSISKAGEIITLTLAPQNETVTVKYDLSKPGFKNLILMQDSQSSMTGLDMADINVHTIDLKKVLFCDSADSDNCAEGDFSDILF